MSAEAGDPGLTESLARARVAVLALAPAEDAELAVHGPDADDWKGAAARVSTLLAVLEQGDDGLRTMLAADMGEAIRDAANRAHDDGGRARLVALLDRALSVLAGDAREQTPGSLPCRSPLALANELRAWRGAPLLSGNMVFAIGLEADAETSGDGDGPSHGEPRLASSARRLRSYYQQGLVAWLREARQAKAAAERIGEVCARLHVLARGTPQEILWRAGASFARLLEDPRWRASVAVKRLLGQLDAELKGLSERQGSAPRPAPALVRDLLFYVGEGCDVDATIGVFPSRSALLAAFVAPRDGHPHQPTAALSLLNALLAVSAEIMEALAPGETWPAKRTWLVGRMLHVADSLGLLNAHALRQRLLDEVALLGATPATGDPPAGGWGQVAERLHVIGADLLTAAGMKPAAAIAENTAGMPTSGHIARRLEADLVHAERVIQRLEQSRGGTSPEPDETEVEPGALLRNRLEAIMAGAVRAAAETAAPAASGESPQVPDVPPAPLALEHGLLDEIAHLAGAIDDARARLEQQVGAFREGLQDMDGGIRALREELEGLRTHAEALPLPDDSADPGHMPDPSVRPPVLGDIRDRLERLAQGVGAIAELRDAIESIAGDSCSALVQQARDNVALEQRLMHSRMQPLAGLLEELGRELGTRAVDAGKQVVLDLDAGDLLIEPEKMAALLPVLRRLTLAMIESGLEPPRARVMAGRPPGCRMTLTSRRRGADLELVVSADCGAPAPATLEEAGAFLRPLGGCLELTASGRFETRLRLRMPLAPRVTTVLLVAVASEILALPLAEVSAVVQLSADALGAGEEEGIEHEGQRWRLGRLGDLLALGADAPQRTAARLPLVLVRSGEVRQALMVDAIGERVDVVVRSIAPQLRALRGLAGAAILGDGQVVLMLDVAELMASRTPDPGAQLETAV